MSLSNKWLSGTCPAINEFYVDKSKTEYYIQYYQTKSGVSKVNTDWKAIKDNAIKLERGIAEIKDAIDSEDYKAQSDALIQAVDAAITAIDENLTKLFTAVVSRMNASAESDEWFSETAALYANYVATAILGLHGAGEIRPNMDALASTSPVNSTSPATTDELVEQILASDKGEGTPATGTETPTTAATEEPKKAGFWGRVGATLGTFASGIVEGVVNIGELAVDTVTVGTAALMTPFTALADGVGAVTSAITGSEYKSATADMWKDAGAFVSKDYSTDWFDSYYNNTSLGKTLKDNSYAFDFTRGAGKFTGEALTLNAGVKAVQGLATGARAISSGSNALGITSGSSNLALTSGSSLPAVRTSGALTRATGATYSSIGNGSIVCDVLDASGNVIGSTTARVVSSTTASPGAGVFRTAASNIGNAARNFGTAAANTASSAARAAAHAPTGVKVAGIAVTGGVVETTKQSSNSNYSSATTNSSSTSTSGSYDDAFNQVVNL